LFFYLVCIDQAHTLLMLLLFVILYKRNLNKTDCWRIKWGGGGRGGRGRGEGFQV